MMTNEYDTTGIIIANIILIPLNGGPEKVKFQIKYDDNNFSNYIGILKDYSEEFIHECIGKKVTITLQPLYNDNGIFKKYIISNMELMEEDKKKEGVKFYGGYD